MHNKALKAFTLIELLIVVAIIAILAAIAVPNFLEAQTRAKVARSKNDLRTLALALESYMLDCGSYPNDSDNTVGLGNQNGFLRLTTPIAYISALLRDPFQTGTEADSSPYYEMGSGSDNQGWGTKYKAQGNGSYKKVHSYQVTGVSSDRKDDTDSNDYWPFATVCRLYDPSNGTISRGDIYRVGGDYRVGTYTVNGVIRGEFN